jgi:hypothetical protein
MHDNPTQAMSETARELIEHVEERHGACQPPCEPQMLARRVEEVLEYCERELKDQYPGAWAQDIMSKLNGEKP